ncbi:MAG TPA: ATP-dependent helicase, partial [Streptomyces sp.]|nr:ATP-dependent helicase [Streptomyces sp.]
MTTLPAATPSEISGLIRCHAVFLPGDPSRTGRIAFWHPGSPEEAPPAGPGSAEDLTVVVPEGPGVTVRTVRATLIPVDRAVPVLTRARAAHAADRGDTEAAAAFWGTASVLALQLAARGRLLPGLTSSDHDA